MQSRQGDDGAGKRAFGQGDADVLYSLARKQRERNLFHRDAVLPIRKPDPCERW